MPRFITYGAQPSFGHENGRLHRVADRWQFEPLTDGRAGSGIDVTGWATQRPTMCAGAALLHLLHNGVGFVTHTTLHTLELPSKPHEGPVIRLIIGDIEMCWTGTLSACYRYIEVNIPWFEYQSECDPDVRELIWPVPVKWRE